MSLGIVPELFKHAPVHLKRLRRLWWREEQICQSGANYTNIVFFFKYTRAGLSNSLKFWILGNSNFHSMKNWRNFHEKLSTYDVRRSWNSAIKCFVLLYFKYGWVPKSHAFIFTPVFAPGRVVSEDAQRSLEIPQTCHYIGQSQSSIVNRLHFFA